MQTARDYRACVVLLRQRHWPHADGVALLEHIDECPVRATLDGGGRHHDHLPQRIDQHANVDELPWPKLKIVVGKLGSELHCAGGLVDLIVDDRHLAFIEGTLAVRCQGIERQLAFGHPLGELRQVLLRQAEKDRDGPKLRQNDDPGGLRPADEIARIDETDAGAASNRRDDIGVGQDGARVIHRRLIQLDLRFQLRDQRPLRVELLLVDGVGCCEARITF